MNPNDVVILSKQEWKEIISVLDRISQHGGELYRKDYRDSDVVGVLPYDLVMKIRRLRTDLMLQKRWSRSLDD